MKKILHYLFVSIVVIVIIISGYKFIQSSNDSQEIPKKKNKEIVNGKNPYDITTMIDENTSKSIYINIEEETLTLNNETIQRWMYTDEKGTIYDAGMPIVVNEGDVLDIQVKNNTNVKTNIHWHGMSVANDQDGPVIIIEPKATYKYHFSAEEAGTYWYHSHERPVRDQVDEGMYAPFIVKAKQDLQYDADMIFMLDDWSVKGGMNHGDGMMSMEVIGDVDTVNGKSGKNMYPIQIKTGDIQKLRFVGSSTALTQELRFPLPVRVTHTDGRELEKPYNTDKLTIAPGERYDVELQMDQMQDQVLYISNNRNNGMNIPIYYTYEKGNVMKESPFVPADASTILSEYTNKKPDITMTLSTNNQGMMDAQGWTINGEVFPNLDAFELKLSKTYVIRFENIGRMHAMAHPMHIHGTHFVVLDINGDVQTSQILKDTIDVPIHGYVDVAVTFDKPGEWMVHCHILDHEDGGMMTSIIVK